MESITNGERLGARDGVRYLDVERQTSSPKEKEALFDHCRYFSFSRDKRVSPQVISAERDTLLLCTAPCRTDCRGAWAEAGGPHRQPLRGSGKRRQLLESESSGTNGGQRASLD